MTVKRSQRIRHDAALGENISIDFKAITVSGAGRRRNGAHYAPNPLQFLVRYGDFIARTRIAERPPVWGSKMGALSQTCWRFYIVFGKNPGNSTIYRLQFTKPPAFGQIRPVVTPSSRKSSSIFCRRFSDTITRVFNVWAKSDTRNSSTCQRNSVTLALCVPGICVN